MQYYGEDLLQEPMNRQVSAEQADNSIRERWLDKLWLCLFDTNSGGLMSPGQIRREHRNRERVRQIEMAAILEAEREINDIHQGIKGLDDYGNLIDTPPVDAVSTHQIIENIAIEQDTDITLETPAMMIRAAVKEVSIRDLERSLNLKKIAILAESEILAADIEPVSERPVNAEWMVRWRESAEDVFNPELQLLWAKMLVKEIAHPERYSLALMTILHQLSSRDIETLLVVAKYTFPEFIYNARESYFNTDFHQGLFEELEDLGLVSANAAINVSLSSQRPSNQLASNQHPSSYQQQGYVRVLVCRNKALKITADNVKRSLELPIIKLNRVGRQLFELTEADTDIAYLFDLANTAKAQGFKVVLGDWEKSGEQKGVFVQKIEL